MEKNEKEELRGSRLSNSARVAILTAGAVLCFTRAIGYAKLGVSLLKKVKEYIDQEIKLFRISGEP
ncbi:MAG: hypothetical protein J7L62_00940 [Candidatus Aminicenantes bacterium]|nr:hypothetical protein [Candidatus Aminicenantes bacterium]